MDNISKIVELEGLLELEKNKPSNFHKVKEFHKIFGQPNNEKLNKEDFLKHWPMRLKLIMEEYRELEEEFFQGQEFNIQNIAKELTDILYVVYGAGATFGIDLDECFDLVHKSNLSKLDKDGKVLYREDGKVLKSDQYKPADMSKVVKIKYVKSNDK